MICRFWAILLLIAVGITQSSSGQTSDSAAIQITPSFTYTADLFANIYGGVDQGVRYMDNIDVILKMDTSTLTFFLYGLGNQGKSISELTGDIQTVSNIDAENSWRLYEMWLEKIFLSLQSSLLIGLYDVNSEFDVINTSQLFVHSSHGIGAEFGSSGHLGPSIFPYTSLAARVKVNPAPGLSIKAAVADAVPSDPPDTKGTRIQLSRSEGALLTGEISYSWDAGTSDHLSRGILPARKLRIAFGGWKYTNERPGWLGKPESDHGLYLLAEAPLFIESETNIQGLKSFIRIGTANSKINRFNSYAGAGLVYTGLFKERNADQLGLALALPVNSNEYIQTQNNKGINYPGNETATELTYLFIFNSALKFQLNIQYIFNPNQFPRAENAFVAGVRSVLSFN